MNITISRYAYKSYNDTPISVKTERMHNLLERLHKGFAIEVDEFFYEEIKFLKDEYGEDLIKSRGRIYLMGVLY